MRSWGRQADIEGDVKPGVVSDAVAEINELEQELREMKRANGILRRAGSFFGAELERQHKMWSFRSDAGLGDT